MGRILKRDFFDRETELVARASVTNGPGKLCEALGIDGSMNSSLFNAGRC